MGEDVVLAQWRQRATALISQTNVHHAVLLNALPHLLIIGNDYRTALRQYALINARDDERQLLDQLAQRAERRGELLLKRYEVTQSQIRTERYLESLNDQIKWTYVAIAAGKFAEMGLVVLTWAKSLKQLVDAYRMFLDGVKAGSAYVEGLNSPANDAAKQAQAVAQISAILLRIDDDLKNLGKAVWDGAATIRRASNMRQRQPGHGQEFDGWAVGATVLQLLKTIFDQLRALAETRGAWGNPLYGNLAAIFGLLRDLLDAKRAIEGASKAFDQANAAAQAASRQALAGERYLGHERHILADFRPEGAWTQLRLDEVMENARDLGTATALVEDVKRESSRLEQNISAAILFLLRQTKRLNQALTPIKPHLEETQDCLNRLDVQINALAWDADRDPRRAPALRKILEQLTAYRFMVSGTYRQAQTLLTAAT